ncbi:MAG TPA: type II toxin-antitoxin system PemK/MazF family toxin [Candidatus Thermoplasmatota archaeon]|nr:type II toxin-antitoxin system PemK/MazF family toxin [Candidatus Thermoplasmatota archaeon]
MTFRPFQAGDVLWAPDPYHENDPDLTLGDSARPWLVVSGPEYPSQGHEYVCCALTSNLAPSPSRLPLSEEDWAAGRPRKASQVDTTTVFTVKHVWVARHIGRLRYPKYAEARKCLRAYLT